MQEKYPELFTTGEYPSFFSYAKLNPYSGQSNNEFEGNSFNRGESVLCQIK